MKKSTDEGVKVPEAVEHIEKLKTVEEVNAFVKGDTRKGVTDAARKRNKQIEDAAAAASKPEADSKPSNTPEEKPQGDTPATKKSGKKGDVPNSYLADRIAGKIDESGRPIKK